MLALVIPYMAAVGMYQMWWGGTSVPARLLTPIVLVLAVALFSGGAEPSVGAEHAAQAPLDQDLATLMKRAEGGDRPALAELLGRAERAKSAPAYKALGRGYFKIAQLDAGLRAYRSAGARWSSFWARSRVAADTCAGSAGAASVSFLVNTTTKSSWRNGDLPASISYKMTPTV